MVAGKIEGDTKQTVGEPLLSFRINHFPLLLQVLYFKRGSQALIQCHHHYLLSAYSQTYSFLTAQCTISCTLSKASCTQSKAFAKSTNLNCTFVFLSRYVSYNCLAINSVAAATLPCKKAKWVSGMLTLC